MSFALAPAIATTAQAVAAPANSRMAVRRKSPKRIEHLEQPLRAIHDYIRVPHLRRTFVRRNADRHVDDGERVQVRDVVAREQRTLGTRAADQLLDRHPL